MQNFAEFSFTYGNATRRVYHQGNGPAVIIMHELPGMIPECVDLARRVAKAGFTVFLPLLFGQPNVPFSVPQTLVYTTQLCISREFYLLAKHKSSPITEWLRALCREVYPRCNNTGVGVIGMCLTGNFVLSMMADAVVMAPVISQPSLPLPLSSDRASALGISQQDLAQAKQRAESGVNLLALRFSEDRTCPAQRFATLRQEFGKNIETIEIDSSKNNPYQIPQNAHAALTMHFVDQDGHPTKEALGRVLAFLQEKLSST